jgi:protein DGCR14
VNATRTIIERDFFPDLARLRARTEWIEARDRNDLPALMQLRQRYGRGASHTAAHTPIALQTPRGDESADTVSSAAFASAAADALPSLNEFVATHVSEDDVAYAALAERDHRRFRERVAWLEESAVKAQLQLHAPDSQRLKMWPFQVRNALMWYPHAIDDAAQLAAQGDPATSIAKANTRFAVPAPVNKRRRVGAAADAADDSAPSTRNEADQFGYVQSPALQPGVDVAPIMTWGKIASTPMRVRDGDHSDDEANDDADDDDEDERMLLATFGADKGPIGQFKVAHSLANTVQERRVRAQRANPPSRSRPTADPNRSVQLSPAGARLAQSLRRGISSSSSSVGLRQALSTPRR